MLTREQLIEAAHAGALRDNKFSADKFSIAKLDLDGESNDLVLALFEEGVFTFDHADVDSHADNIPVRVVKA
jgi:hypothetical protein